MQIRCLVRWSIGIDEEETQVNRMNKANIDKFIEYENASFSEKRCVDKIIIIWLFNVFFYFVGFISIYTSILVSVTNIIVSIFLLKLMNKLDKKENRFLFNGIFKFYLSCMMILMSYNLLNTANLYILLCCFLALFLSVSILWWIVFLIVNKGKYKYKSKETKSSLYPYAGALFGYLLVKFIFENLEVSQENIKIIVAVILFAFAIGLNCTDLDLMKFVLKKIIRNQ